MFWGCRGTAKTTFQAFNEVYRTGIPTKHLDWELTKKDGGRIIVETSVAPMKDSSGQLVGFRGVTHDVTLRKQMEEEIKRLAITDPLTGLYNRRGFLTLAEQQLKISERLKKGLDSCLCRPGRLEDYQRYAGTPER